MDLGGAGAAGACRSPQPWDGAGAAPSGFLAGSRDGGAAGIFETDTNQIGWGETLDAAIEDLEQTTPGHLFLDTVQTLIVRPDAQFLLDDFRQLLRPDVRVCQSSDELDMERVGEYLGEHTPETKLMDADADTMLPTLRCTEGRCILEN